MKAFRWIRGSSSDESEVRVKKSGKGKSRLGRLGLRRSLSNNSAQIIKDEKHQENTEGQHQENTEGQHQEDTHEQRQRTQEQNENTQEQNENTQEQLQITQGQLRSEGKHSRRRRVKPKSEIWEKGWSEGRREPLGVDNCWEAERIRGMQLLCRSMERQREKMKQKAFLQRRLSRANRRGQIFIDGPEGAQFSSEGSFQRSPAGSPSFQGVTMSESEAGVTNVEQLQNLLTQYRLRMDALLHDRNRLAANYEGSVQKYRALIFNVEAENQLLQAEIDKLEREARHEGPAESFRARSSQRKSGNASGCRPDASPGCDANVHESSRRCRSAAVVETENEGTRNRGEVRSSIDERQETPSAKESGRGRTGSTELLGEGEARIRQLELDNHALREELSSQRLQYDRSLDDIANQIIQALLSQRSLRNECNQLHSQLEQLQRQNRRMAELLRGQDVSSANVAGGNDLGSLNSLCSDINEHCHMDDSIGKPRMCSPPSSPNDNSPTPPSWSVEAGPPSPDLLAFSTRLEARFASKSRHTAGISCIAEESSRLSLSGSSSLNNSSLIVNLSRATNAGSEDRLNASELNSEQSYSCTAPNNSAVTDEFPVRPSTALPKANRLQNDLKRCYEVNLHERTHDLPDKTYDRSLKFDSHTLDYVASPESRNGSLSSLNDLLELEMLQSAATSAPCGHYVEKSAEERASLRHVDRPSSLEWIPSDKLGAHGQFLSTSSSGSSLRRSLSTSSSMEARRRKSSPGLSRKIRQTSLESRRSSQQTNGSSDEAARGSSAEQDSPAVVAFGQPAAPGCAELRCSGRDVEWKRSDFGRDGDAVAVSKSCNAPTDTSVVRRAGAPVEPPPDERDVRRRPSAKDDDGESANTDGANTEGGKCGGDARITDLAADDAELTDVQDDEGYVSNTTVMRAPSGSELSASSSVSSSLGRVKNICEFFERNSFDEGSSPRRTPDNRSGASPETPRALLHSSPTLSSTPVKETLDGSENGSSDPSEMRRENESSEEMRSASTKLWSESLDDHSPPFPFKLPVKPPINLAALLSLCSPSAVLPPAFAPNATRLRHSLSRRWHSVGELRRCYATADKTPSGCVKKWNSEGSILVTKGRAASGKGGAVNIIFAHKTSSESSPSPPALPPFICVPPPPVTRASQVARSSVDGFFSRALSLSPPSPDSPTLSTRTPYNSPQPQRHLQQPTISAAAGGVTCSRRTPRRMNPAVARILEEEGALPQPPDEPPPLAFDDDDDDWENFVAEPQVPSKDEALAELSRTVGEMKLTMQAWSDEDVSPPEQSCF